MVTLYRGHHEFKHDFETVTNAYLYRYPNPYSSHVVSTDVISQKIDQQGRLILEMLFQKRGQLPAALRPILGSITDSWILEKTIVDRKARTLTSVICNLDHRKILVVNDRAEIRATGSTTAVDHIVCFKSGLTVGVRQKVEEWSKRHFAQSFQKSRMGLAFVVERLAHAKQSVVLNG